MTTGEDIESIVVALLKAEGLRVGVAESLTGGMLAYRFSEVPGVSDVFAGGIVCYASDVKYRVLRVPEGPVVCEVAARAMAEGTCRLLDVPVSAAVTGVAGPETQDGQPVGTVITASCVEGAVRCTEHHVDGGRQEIQRYAATAALEELRHHLISR